VNRRAPRARLKRAARAAESKAMAADRTALLFCPPFAPVEIPAGGRVAIGRGRDCDLPVATDDASRRHAEVYTDDGLYLVRDLSSRNGTFVNGELIGGPRALRPGDRIGVGSAAITFCIARASLDGLLSDPDGQETVLFAKKGAGDAFSGDLAEMPVFVVLQMLEMGHKSGLLEVETDQGPARVWLGDGQPLHAETEKADGLQAAVVLVGASRGRFRFDAGATLPERTLELSMTELLLEASRLLDEQGR
jgi:pSer/pThr/pTyr-binding forkhead associated (FHA) protein